jgi:hypothetical protein
MMTPRYAPHRLAAAFAGLFLALAIYGQAHATTTYTMEFMGGGYFYMNCGWHGACGATPTPGTALDWKDYPDHYVYFRVWAYQSSGAEATIGLGTLEVIDDGWNCHAVYINISSPASQVYRGSEKYLHTTSAYGGNTIDIVANTSGKWTQSQFATTLQWLPGMVSPENPNCQWGGPHSHQLAYWVNPSNSSRNTSYFPGYVNAGPKDVDVQGHHQDKGWWSY